MAITDQLLATWSFDESSGNAADASGNGKTLTNNGTTAFASALINNGASFGSTNTTKYFSRSDSSGWSDGAFSISLWVKLSTDVQNGTYSQQTFGFASLKTTNQYAEIRYEWNGGTPHLWFQRQRAGFAGTNFYYNVTLGTSSWHHIVFTYDGTNLVGYLDGVSVTTATDTNTGGSGGTASTRVGTSEPADGEYTNGLMDITAIWSRGITSGEVTTLYNGGVGVQYPFAVTPKSSFLIFM